MTLQLAKLADDTVYTCPSGLDDDRVADHSLVPMADREAGLEMPGLVLSILAATLTGDDSHV